MDFRLWVCLHEQTHAVQFAAAPWLAGHLAEHIAAMGARLAEPEDGSERLRAALDALIDVIRQRTAGADLLHSLLSEDEQRELDRVIAVMSLLEGHADVVMDGVGPSVIGSVKRIRKQFTARRGGTSSLDRLLRRLLGLEAKMAQYRDGAAFVRAVVDKVGMDDFNAVWAEPANLPSKLEIHEPQAWVSRIHG